MDCKEQMAGLQRSQPTWFLFPLLPQIRREVHLSKSMFFDEGLSVELVLVRHPHSKTSQLMPTPSLGPPSSQGRPGVCVTDAPWFGDSPWFQGHCRNPKVVLQEMVGESEACPSTPMISRVFFWGVPTPDGDSTGIRWI